MSNKWEALLLSVTQTCTYTPKKQWYSLSCVLLIRKEPYVTVQHPPSSHKEAEICDGLEATIIIRLPAKSALTWPVV